MLPPPVSVLNKPSVFDEEDIFDRVFITAIQIFIKNNLKCNE